MAFDTTKVDNVDRVTASDWNALVLYLKGKGNKVVSQTSAPSTAVDGEYWYDTSATKLKLRVSGAWIDLTLTGPAGPTGATGAKGDKGDKGDTGAAGSNGTNGTDGKTILYGTTAPTTEGVDGDFYIDITTHTVYGPKASGTWPAGTSMIGPTGASGSGAGDVVGPATATDTAVARFDGSGTLLQNSLVTIDDVGSVNIPTGQVYKINGTALTATDVNAASSTHDHAGVYLPTTGTAADSELLDSHDSTYFATAAHDHASTYLGIADKAADADKLDGIDSTGFATSAHDHASTYLGLLADAENSKKLGGALPAAYVLSTAIGTAAAKNVPTTGDAADTEAVLGSDTRLTNARAPTTHNHDAAYAPIAKGVTNGDSHDHNGGDGGQIAYSSLSGAPTTMTPTAHAASHATGQADAITPGNIGAATTGHSHDAAYLGITAKAADSDTLDGHDTAYFATADHTHSSLQLLEALGTDRTVSGLTVYLTAGASVTIGQVCYINSSSQAALADGDAIATMPVRVMAAASITSGAAGVFLLTGYMRDDSLTFTPGATLYASGTAGAITHTAPSGASGVVQSIGYAITSHIMYFSPGTYVELV